MYLNKEIEADKTQPTGESLISTGTCQLYELYFSTQLC